MNFSKISLCLSVITAAASAESFSATSEITHRLVSRSRALENNNGYSQWMTKYSIKFDSCHNVMQYGSNGEDGDNGDDDNSSPVVYQGLVKFRLCPYDTCETSKKCSGPEYIVNLRDFVDMYTQAKLNELEMACENVQENCVCQDDYVDEDTCEAQCYAAAGLEGCQDEENDDDDGNGFEFDMQEYLECQEIEFNNNNNNNNGNNNNAVYSVGPYCADNGKSIFLGVFADETCSTKASDDFFYSAYGVTLPYSTTTIIDGGCVSCKDQDNDNDNNNNGNNYAQVSESCEEIYDMAGKCEENMAATITYPNTQSCTYMHSVLPSFEQLEKSNYQYKSGNVAKAFAWVWFMSTCGLSYYVYSLKTQKNVALSSQGGMAA